MTSRQNQLARARLDKRLQDLQAIPAILPPKGWIRAIRDALGMTTAQLARRIGMTQQNVTRLEQSESRGSIQLDTLRKTAEALDCTLVYALVPKTSLTDAFNRRARTHAEKALRRVEHTMALEDQSVKTGDREERIDHYVRDVLRDREVWDDAEVSDDTSSKPFVEPDGATPLDPEEREGLLLNWIGTRDDLNEAEQANIALASAWAFRWRRDVVEESFVRELHQRMFRDVWTWAGTYRRTNKNIGIDAREIRIALHSALGDIRFAIEHQSMAPLEISVRLHHRLVFIHPFMNGNGRHARLMADLIAKQLRLRPLTWGSADLGSPSAVRKRYIAALKAADNHDIAPLIAFAHS